MIDCFQIYIDNLKNLNCSHPPPSTIKDTSDVLRDLVPFVQFKKREKHAWRSVTFIKVAG